MTVSHSCKYANSVYLLCKHAELAEVASYLFCSLGVCPSSLCSSSTFVCCPLSFVSPVCCISRYPTRWDGNSIVVLDQYVVQPPYQAENIASIRGQEGTADGLSRLTKVVRKKLLYLYHHFVVIYISI